MHLRNGWGGRIRTYGTRDQNPWILLSGVIRILISLLNSSYASHVSYALSEKSRKVLSKIKLLSKQRVEVSLRIITYSPVIKRYEERQVRIREERNRKYEHKWAKMYFSQLSDKAFIKASQVTNEVIQKH